MFPWLIWFASAAMVLFISSFVPLLLTLALSLEPCDQLEPLL